MPKKSDDRSKAQRHNRVAGILATLSAESALSITELWERLQSEGFQVDRKTIERDVRDLSRQYPALCETGSNPARFYFADGFKLDYSLQFTEEQLQTIILALGSLRVSAPPVIQRLCTEAEDTMLAHLPTALQAQFKKLKALSANSRTNHGRSGDVDGPTYQAILRCLKEEIVFDCRYQKPDRPAEERRFAPLMLNFSGGTPYLFVYDLRDMVIKTLRLSRLSHVVPTRLKVNRGRVKEISLDYVMGGFGRGGEELVDYVVYGPARLATVFREQAFHPSQQITPVGEDLYCIRFTMTKSYEVIRTLAQYGDLITKIEPADAYTQVQEIWRRGLKVVA